MVRVVVYLHRWELEELDLLVTCRQGALTRSELVREAISKMRAHEALVLVRARAQRERWKREAEELERARSIAGQERARQAVEETVAQALGIARGDA